MKFLVFPCVKKNEELGYDGSVITLTAASNISIALFFPVLEDNAKIINYVLNTEADGININSMKVGIYKTMLDAWAAGDRYLSGITMGVEYDQESEEDMIDVNMIVSNAETGLVDSIVKSSFVHAIILAAMEKREIIISDELLAKLLPEDETEEVDDDDDDRDDRDDSGEDFPSDPEISEIAAKIISGKQK